MRRPREAGEDAVAYAEPLEGPPDQSEIIGDAGVILVLVLGTALLINVILMMSDGG